MLHIHVGRRLSPLEHLPSFVQEHLSVQSVYENLVSYHRIAESEPQ